VIGFVSLLRPEGRSTGSRLDAGRRFCYFWCVETRLAWLSAVFAGIAAIGGLLAAGAGIWAAQIARQQLTIDQQPMAVVYCTFPRKAPSPDYVVSLNLQRPRFPILTAAWFGVYTVPAFTQYTDCRIQNYGKYPLMNLTLVLDVDFSRVTAPGKPPTVVSHTEVPVTVEGIAADSTEHVFVVNDDVCNIAGIGIEGNLSFLNVPYQKSTSFLQPGRSAGPGRETYVLNAVGYPSKVRRALERSGFVPRCPPV
jgi:hypothetical protein